jgi:hypothetical protein
MVPSVNLRLIAAFAVIGALLAGGFAASRERDYRAHAYVIKVPPAYGDKRGLAFARGERVLSRVASDRPVAWLRRHSRVQLTGRRDFAISVRAPSEAEAVALATAYAKALKRSLRPVPGLVTQGRAAHRARLAPGPFLWALLGGVGGLWIGAAVAIVRSGSARAPRRASPACARATEATPG